MAGILGGLMNIYEHDAYPWLVTEKQFIRCAIDAGKKVLGVCLGGQLIADVLGGKVIRNHYPEIGWHPIRLLPLARKYPLFEGISDELMAFHWHGNTFTIPSGAIHLASSSACTNQAFLYGSNVLGLQFHLEYSQDSILIMLKECKNELIQSPYVQNAEQIRQNMQFTSVIQGYMDILLDRFVTMQYRT